MLFRIQLLSMLLCVLAVGCQQSESATGPRSDLSSSAASDAGQQTVSGTSQSGRPPGPLRRQLNEARQQLTDTKKQLQESVQAIEDLQRQLQAEQYDHKVARTRLIEAQHQIDEQRDINLKLTGRLNEMQQQHAATNKTIEHLCELIVANTSPYELRDLLQAAGQIPEEPSRPAANRPAGERADDQSAPDTPPADDDQSSLDDIKN